MKNRFFKAAVAFLFTIAISLGMFANEAWASFSLTCYNSSVNGSTLSSTCYMADGYTPNQTEINLNPYIGNIDGELMWQHDNFIATCGNTELSGPSVLVGECEKRAQQWVQAEINLDDHISNINGILTYQ
ncbi:MAG: cyanovirin [Okeania sp. SIO3B5]|uniref:mannose-binding lectin n=1 Tax=Okeania sp. SIO3B5 TaxID=2607811 RepID=UPI0013FF7945|nr:CVNH domain-containing protein [Okeania sp. SIO3B5]NEO56179.1 cyanovirin [Okeania sp. SIO3B5]